jgi:hypothetical protein
MNESVIRTFNMKPEDSLKLWLERSSELEQGLLEAVKVIKTLQNSANWPPSQKREIQAKIEELENILVPF